MARILELTSKLLFVILALALMDTVSGGFFVDKNLHLVRGESEYLTAKLDRPVEVGTGFALEVGQDKANQILDYKTDAQGVHLNFVEISGRDWRALATVDATAQTGDYVLQVFRRGSTNHVKEPVHTLRVFRNKAAASAMASTFSERHFGFPPFYAILAVIPPLVLCFFITFQISGRKLKVLDELGIGPIYRVTKRKEHWELLVGLGKIHGIVKGATLLVLNPDRVQVGEIVVDKVEIDTSTATVPLDRDVRHDYLVMLKA
ncbi:MAG: hypothetical protein KKF77_01930 [Proteobacteria bacterium]|nr:hypothetical protein [Pseudomonadota bacterium]